MTVDRRGKLIADIIIGIVIAIAFAIITVGVLRGENGPPPPLWVNER